MMNVEEMVKRFHLEKEVEEFVKKRVRELIPNAHAFSFSGSDSTGYCENKEPHIPHVRSFYNTVVWGSLARFCTGREGLTPEGYLHIVVTKRVKGDAYSPSYVRGYWWIEKEVGE
jgi:hypothetical protein